ncbi:unnamed protein product, partial [marine sediment metagenome]
LIHLALTIVGATTWAVQQTFVTCRQGTDASSLSQDALTTLCANLLKTARIILDAYEKSIQCWNDRLVNIGTQLMHS